MESSRREFIKKTSLLSSIGIIGSGLKSFAISSKVKPEPELIIGHGQHKYKVDKGWAKISANANPLINCHEMVEDSQGRLIMIGDHTNNNILIFDKSGKLLDFWGHSFPGGHGLTIGKEGGEDFLLITDTGHYQDKTGKGGTQGGQVMKMTVSGAVHFAIGHPKTIGIYKPEDKFMPTETAVAPNGDIYVADGYGSDYIIQYDSNGKYIRHFGGHNNANPDHNLSNAHGVAVDIRDKNNYKLIVTSRNENCFKVFTMDGKYIEKIELPGMHICRPVMHGSNIYAGVCWSKDAEGKTNWGNSGFVTILDAKNKVISNPGGMEPVYKNNTLQPTLVDNNNVFSHGHDVCIDTDDNVYVCQWNANRTPPIKLTRV